MSSAHRSSASRAAALLCEATEALQVSVVEDAPPEALREAYDRREAAFAALKSAIESGECLDETGRVDVARVRTLDAALVQAGSTLAESVRGERQDLHRARSVIQAHTAREREQPRLVAVKA